MPKTSLCTHAKEDPQCNSVETVMWRAKWIHGEFAQGTKYKDTIGKIQKILHSWWKRGAATPISNIDNFGKHVYREHNQEADHLANIGAQEEETLISKGKTPQQHGKRYVVSWTEASKMMVGAAAE